MSIRQLRTDKTGWESMEDGDKIKSFFEIDESNIAKTIPERAFRSDLRHKKWYSALFNAVIGLNTLYNKKLSADQGAMIMGSKIKDLPPNAKEDEVKKFEIQKLLEHEEKVYQTGDLKFATLVLSFVYVVYVYRINTMELTIGFIDKKYSFDNTRY